MFWDIQVIEVLTSASCFVSEVKRDLFPETTGFRVNAQQDGRFELIVYKALLTTIQFF